ncbi:hypothetical protein D9741_14220, partial [Escherichia sp. E14V7]
MYSSGTVADTTVNGGDQYLFDGGTATGTTLNGVDSSQFIYENSIATDTTLNNARQFVSSGGTAINTTINNGSDQQVLAGGIAIESLNNSGGQLRVSSGGSATKVTNKGMLLVLDGGTATEVNQAVGAGLITSTDATVKGTNVNGAFSIDAASHTASNVLLENSASLSVNNSGTATNTTVNRKGTLSVSSGGVLAGNTLINEGGTLKGQNSAVVNQGILTMDGEQGTQNWSLQGSGSLVKTGDGSLTMTRGGTYSGGTVISGGTLNANDLKALGSGDIDNSATLNLNAFGTYVAGDVTTHNGGVTSLAAGTMLDATSLNQQDGSTLNITLGNGVTSPVITADTVNIDGSLNITGIGNISAPLSHDPYTFTLIDADNSITGNFDNITIGGMDAGMVDFMTIGGKISATDDSQYVLTSTLTWYADISHLSTDAHGTFTLSGPGDRFELNTALADVVPNSTTGWDGKTLTKAGEGTLILNASNTYSGDTYVNGGTLIAGTDNALGTDGGLVLASGATFELNGMSQSSNYLRSDAGSTLKLDGGELVLGRNIHQTSEISGTVTGSGLLDIYGSLDIDEESDLSGLSATIDIEQYADVYSWNAALGTGNIVVDGTLQMNAPAGELSNNLSGSGSIWAESALTVSGDNDDFSGTWTIRKDSSLTVMNAPALGTGNVVDGGALYLGGTDNWALNSGNVISDYAMYDGDNLVDASAGKVVKQDANTITITNANSYSGGTLIEKGTLNADHVAALGTGDVDNHATLNLNAVGQYVLANFTTYSAGTTSLVAGSTLAVDAFVQQDDSTLNISLAPDATSPLVIADSASLDGTLNITGIGNIKDPLTHDPYTFTLIDADSAISGDFEELTVAGIEAKETDFLTVDSRINPADDTQYELTTSLSWYADVDNAATDAHGTFTLSNPDGSFTLNTALTDVDANSSTGWDGKTLTKAGDGTLILNVSNTYSGDTYVNGGTLVAGADNALGTDGGLVLASGATFDLNGMSQSSDYLRSDVGSTLNLDGGELVLGR